MSVLTTLILAHAGAHEAASPLLPPLHPLLVNFPAALVPSSLVLDLIGRRTKRESLCHAAFWTLLIAAVVSPFTAWAGWAWLDDMPEMNAWGEMTVHKWLGTALAALLPLFALWRWRSHSRSAVPSWSYLIVLGLLVAGVVIQGHLGALMSFGGADKPISPATTQPTDTAAEPEVEPHRHAH